MADVKFDNDECIQCEACELELPEMFEIGDDGYPIFNGEVNDDTMDDIQNVIDACPVACIIVE